MANLQSINVQQNIPNQIFKEEDINLIKKYQRKVITTPIYFLGFSLGIWFISRKFNLLKILRNPLHSQEIIKNNDFRWRYVFINGIVMGTIGVGVGTYFKKEIYKFNLYKKYEKQVNYYIRWQINQEISTFISK